MKKKTVVTTVLFVAIGYVIGIACGFTCGKEEGRKEMNTELREAAVKSPIYCTSKDGTMLVMKRESFNDGLKQPIGFR